MRKIFMSDIELLDIGNEIQLWGAVYAGKSEFMLVPLPDEDADEAIVQTMGDGNASVLVMDSPQWEAFLRQTDYLNVAVGPTKAILRKSQRQIDSAMSWKVFRRDGFKCRYCGGEKPLTVDHVDLWEDGGVTTEENLISACRDCNKTRGNRAYDEWIESKDYQKRAARLPESVKKANKDVVATLDDLKAKRVSKQRSR